MPRGLFLSPCQASAPPRRAAGAFFLRVVGELDFHYIAVERALLVEQGRRGRGEAVRAVVAAGPVSQPKNCGGLFSVLSDIGTRFSRSRISVARSALFDVSLVLSNQVDRRGRPVRGKCLARHHRGNGMGYV